MRAIDTNVLVRLIVRDDIRQARAAEAFVAPGAWVSHLVLAETAWVLTSVYAFDRARLGMAIELLLAQSELAIESAEVVARALARFRGHRRVAFTDCLIVETAVKAGHTPLGTFDRALAATENVERV